MDKKELLRDVLESLNDYDFVEVWNAYSYTCDRIYCMDEFDDVMSNYSASELLECLSGDFSIYDDFFMDDNCYWISFNCPVVEVELDDLIEYIIENDDDFGDYDIRELLDSEDFALAS